MHRSVTYKPLNIDMIIDPHEGELVYNAGDRFLYLYNGTNWVKQGASGGADIYVKTGSNPVCDSGYSEAIRYWKSKRCGVVEVSNFGGCSTPLEYSFFQTPPKCSYLTSWLDVLFCTADSWSKVICVKD